MLKQEETVSVVIPVYNGEEYIRETLGSVISQTYTNIEILVIDDGSKDRSIEFCQKFKDFRIKIFSQQNRGLSGARNRGIKEAKGQYIAFLDADDVWLPEKVEKHVKHLDNNPHLGISFSYSAFIDSKSNPMGIYQTSQIKNIEPQYILYRNPIGNGSTAFFRKEVFEDIKYTVTNHNGQEEMYFDENFRLSQDIECWIRIALQTSWKMEGIPEFLTLYRIHQEGISADLQPKIKSLNEVLEKTRLYAPEFIKSWENVAKAYYCRYIARRSINLKDASMAIKMFNLALIHHWKIVLEEPFRTITTGFAAYLIAILPFSLYQRLQNIVIKATDYNHRQKVAN